MKRKRKELMEQEMCTLPDEIIREYEEKYFLLLKKEKKKTERLPINMQSGMKKHFLTD